MFGMSNWLIIVTAVLLIWTAGTPSLAVVAHSNDAQLTKYSDDEKIIRAQAQAYIKYFAAGDASAIAAMWTPDGTFIDSDGVEFRGRSEIEKLYAHYFAEHGKQALDLSITSINFPAANVAIEEGRTHLSNAPADQMGSKYVVVHVKQSGKWQVSNSTETNIKPISKVDSLQDLSWLIGSWTPEFAKGKIAFTMNWVGNKHFINCTFVLHGLPIEEISDIQMIGWDPLRQEPTSWNFSATGGFGRALWAKDGENWLLRAHSIQQDGSTGQATYILHKINNDTFTWQSVRRSLDGCSLPDTPEVKIIRESGN